MIRREGGEERNHCTMMSNRPYLDIRGTLRDRSTEGGDIDLGEGTQTDPRETGEPKAEAAGDVISLRVLNSRKL